MNNLKQNNNNKQNKAKQTKKEFGEVHKFQE